MCTALLEMLQQKLFSSKRYSLPSLCSYTKFYHVVAVFKWRYYDAILQLKCMQIESHEYANKAENVPMLAQGLGTLLLRQNLFCYK